MKVSWTASAQEDLEDIGQYISIDSPKSAVDLLQRLRTSADRLSRFPDIGRVGKIEGTRELVVPGTEYFIVYAIRQKKVIVLGVIHGARQWPD